MPPAFFSLPSCSETSELPCEEVSQNIGSRILQLLENAWPAFKGAIKAIFYFIISLPWTIPAAILAINEFTREHPYGCGIPMVLQFITRVPVLFLILGALPLSIYSIVLSIVGEGVTGVRGGTLTADFRTGTYTYGSISPSTHNSEKTTKDLSEKEESSMNVSPIVAIFPSKIKVAIALIQFVVFVLGIGVLFRHALSGESEP